MGDEFLDVEVVFDEVVLEVGEGVFSVGGGALLGEVVEEAVDEGAVGGGAFDGETGDVLRAVNFDDFSVFGRVIATGVDRFVLGGSSKAADGIKIFE